MALSFATSALMAGCGGGGDQPTAVIEAGAALATTQAVVPLAATADTPSIAAVNLTSEEQANDSNILFEPATVPLEQLAEAITDQGTVANLSEVFVAATLAQAPQPSSTVFPQNAAVIAATVSSVANQPPAVTISQNTMAYAGTVTLKSTSRADSKSDVSLADVIATLDPDKPLAAQTWSGLNCGGQFPALSKLPAAGLAGSTAAGENAIRFGPASDPLDSARNAFVVNVHANDPLTAGGKRCEAVALPTAATGLPQNENFWYAFRIMPWVGMEARSGSALLTQWHVQGFNPFLSLVLKDGRLGFTARYNANTAATQANSTTIQLWRDSAPAERRWSTFVVQAKISPFTSDNPYVRIWRDGVLIVNRNGPIGYNSTGIGYAKIGYYHWTDDNFWDEAVPQRTIYLGKATMVRDARNRYTESNLRGEVGTQ